MVTCFGLFEYISQDLDNMCIVFNRTLEALFPLDTKALNTDDKILQPTSTQRSLRPKNMSSEAWRSSYASLPLEMVISVYINIVQRHMREHAAHASILRGIVLYGIRYVLLRIMTLFRISVVLF